MADGEALRFQILRHLKEAEHARPGPTRLEDMAQELDVSEEEVGDQLDILDDLGAIDANRTLGGSAVPMLKGRGKMLLEEMEQELRGEPSTSEVSNSAEPSPDFEWDAFIAHASEDKDAFVQPLAVALSKDFRIWYDDFTLTVGDSLRRAIDKGLKNSRFGIVVLSKHFFQKEWPQKELDGLVTKERQGTKVILPVWLDVEYEDVANYSPLLADRVAAKARDGLDRVVAALSEAMGGKVARTKPTPTQRQRKYIEVTENDDRIKSDGVLWEWETYFAEGKGGMDGPLCPKDLVRLNYQTPTPPLPSIRGLLGEEEERPGLAPLFPPSPPSTPEYFGTGRKPTDQDTVGGFGGGRLFCIKCPGAYLFSGPPFEITFAGKTVGDARRDAAILFEAKARIRRAK